MSWPADGLPRFVITVSSGNNSTAAGGGLKGREEHLTACVLDRAFCHRVVGRWRSEVWRHRGINQARTEALRLADERCDELNGVAIPVAA